MTRATFLGLEYHDLGVRMAAVVEGKLLPLPNLPDGKRKYLVFDKYNGMGPLPISFTSFFSTVGTGQYFDLGGETANADEFVHHLLEVMRRMMEDKIGSPVRSTMVAVPMYMTSAKREGLLKACAKAGLREVSLIDAHIPAGMAYASGQERPTTQLVYMMDYGACSFALLRSVKGRLKALDQGFVPEASGQLCDALIMNEIHSALRERNVFMGLNSFGMRHWMEFRLIAETARQALARKPVADVDLIPALVGDQRPVRLTMSAEGLGTLLAPVIAPTIDEMQAVLERNQIQSSEIDAIVVIGEVARLPMVADLLDDLWPGKVQIADQDVIAAAAAMQLAGQDDSLQATEQKHDFSYYLTPHVRQRAPLNGSGGTGAPKPLVTAVEIGEARPLLPATGAQASQATQPAQRAQPAPVPAAGAASDPMSAKAVALDLVNQGRFQEAAQLLQQLDAMGRQAQSATGAALAAEQSAAHPVLSEAGLLLAQGRLNEAVQLSHIAYEGAKHNPHAFEGMLDVHLKAALGLETPTDYPSAIQILMCAYSHDQTNIKVQKAISARHLQHAQHLQQTNNRAEAKAVLAEALRFSPKDAVALALWDELGKDE